ncbi:MAG: hypothetical protein M3436_16985 [Pseudomonadota bacterium]|nr:hypothetical protein [Pseudomonadota bacterium]
MSAAESLARLNPKIQSFISRGGGFNALTPLDIAAGLAGAPQNAQRTALAAFAGFPEPLLPGLVEARLWRLAKLEGWKNSREVDSGEVDSESAVHYPLATSHCFSERIRRIAALAVWEYCEPPRCGECQGRMIVYAPQPGTCLACNGSGYGRLRASVLCDAIGVSLGEWRRGAWRYRYNRAYSIVSGWGSEALAHLHRRLNEEDS